MAFPLRQVTPPASEPVSLVDMKNYLRVDVTDDDDLISTLISVARERCEDLTARCLVSQSWEFAFDEFPSYGCWSHLHHRHGRSGSLFAHNPLEIILPRGPVLSVDSITYKDQTGTVQTLDPSAYNTDLLSQPARITPTYGTTWPVALHDTNSVTINFTCGYTTIPFSILHAIKLIVGAWYESRAEVTQGGGNYNSFPMPLSAQSLLATYELFQVGYSRA